MKTKKQLEISFDRASFSKIFVDPNKTDEPLSWRLEPSENVDIFDDGDGAICIPIKNYLLDRFMGTNHSMMNGSCSLWLRLPLLIEKKGVEFVQSIYAPELWNLQMDDSFDSHDELLRLITPDFLEDAPVIYPSLLASFDKKIRFAEFGLLFWEEEDIEPTSLEDQRKITTFIESLMDNDDFINYLLNILIPLMLVFVDDQLLSEKKLINSTRRQIKSFRESI